MEMDKEKGRKIRGREREIEKVLQAAKGFIRLKVTGAVHVL